MNIYKKLQFFAVATVLSLGLAQNTFAQATDSSTMDNSTDTRDSRISKGGFFLEPMISMVRDESSIKTSQLPIITDDTSGTSQGYGLGLKLGGHVSEIVLLGVDARYTKQQMQDSFYNTADTDAYNWGPTIGVQTPLYGIRLLGTYVVGGESNPAAGVQGLDLKFREARGARVGLGVHVAAVGVSLEYQDLTYDTTDVESIGSISTDQPTRVDSNTRGYGLNISFPIEL